MTTSLPDASLDVLFDPLTLASGLELPNRVLMAPMTRSMAGDGSVPNPASAAYYARRADAGLIVTEGTIIGPRAAGYPQTPGIWSPDQVRGWKRVTRSVHDAGGRIFCQLWHVGRVSHPHFLAGELPVAPSAVALEGRVPRTDDLHYPTPRALEDEEIHALVEEWGNAAVHAMEAGFDGIEIHGANGYLIDQFLHWHTNRRTDRWGGTPENMGRFPLDVVDRVVAAAGDGRVGVRLAPGAYFNMMPDPRDGEVFALLLSALSRRSLAYVHGAVFDDSMTFDSIDGQVSSFIRSHYAGVVVGNGGYTPEAAADAIRDGRFDLIAIGRSFIANSDLMSRIRSGRPLEPYDAAMLATLE